MDENKNQKEENQPFSDFRIMEVREDFFVSVYNLKKTAKNSYELDKVFSQQGFPDDLQGRCSANFLFSKTFETFIVYEGRTLQIKNLKNKRPLYTVPSDMLDMPREPTRE